MYDDPGPGREAETWEEVATHIAQGGELKCQSAAGEWQEWMGFEDDEVEEAARDIREYVGVPGKGGWKKFWLCGAAKKDQWWG